MESEGQRGQPQSRRMESLYEERAGRGLQEGGKVDLSIKMCGAPS